MTDFIVVDAVVKATREPIHLNKVEIKAADGVTYLGANRSELDRADLTGFQFAPDIPVRGSFVIEMPADKLPGAVLHVMEKAIFSDLEPQATIPLDVSKSELDGLRTDVAIVKNASDYEQRATSEAGLGSQEHHRPALPGDHCAVGRLVDHP